MTQQLEVSPVPAVVARRGVVAKLLHDPLGVVALALIIVITLVSVFAFAIAPLSPNASSLDDIFAPISPEHLLGGDSAGRDLFSRLLYGAQTSLLGAALALVICLAIGVPAGLIAGYYGKAFESAASWVSDLLMALPSIVVLLALRTVIGPSVWASMAVFGVMLAPGTYRLVRASVSSVKNELYVDAAKVSGLGDASIMARHVLRTVRGPVIMQAAMVLAISINIQAGLEFLGFGDSSVASWGSMLNEGFLNIFQAPQMLLWPGLALGVTTAALALFASSLRDALQGGERATKVKIPTEPSAAASATLPEGESEALLSIRGLRVAYASGGREDSEVVHGVSLEVASGEIVGLVGESGSGKTQIALATLGLTPDGGAVTGGSIRYGGVELVGAGAKAFATIRGQRIAYIPQEPMSNLDPAFRIGNQLSEVVRVHLGMTRKQAREHVIGLLERVGIPDPVRTYRAYPHEISGGMAQRVLIAGAVSCGPELLIADEPTTALDVTVQAEILDLLRDLQKEQDLGILLVTHNFGVVADICERVIVMKQGEIVEMGPAQAIFDASEHPYTRSLLDAMLEGREPRGELIESEADRKVM